MMSLSAMSDLPGARERRPARAMTRLVVALKVTYCSLLPKVRFVPCVTSVPPSQVPFATDVFQSANEAPEAGLPGSSSKAKTRYSPGNWSFPSVESYVGRGVRPRPQTWVPGVGFWTARAWG